MRARLSLGSLRIQSERPKEAIEFVQQTVPYYEKGKFLRETTQALILLTRAQNQLGRVNEAEQTSHRAVSSAEKLGDAEQSGIAHADLAIILMERGNFPSALAEQEQALKLYANIRGGLYAAPGFATLALIESKAGLFAKSAEAVSNAESRLAKLEGNLTQLRSAILCTQAEAAYAQRQWTQTARFARQALALPANEADPNARLLAGLAAIRMSKIGEGLSQASASVEQYDQKDRKTGVGRSSLGKQSPVRRAGVRQSVASLFRAARELGSDLAMPPDSGRSESRRSSRPLPSSTGTGNVRRLQKTSYSRKIVVLMSLKSDKIRL
jgi:tetratricopeptide (TPR) repeat protein